MTRTKRAAILLLALMFVAIGADYYWAGGCLDGGGTWSWALFQCEGKA